MAGKSNGFVGLINILTLLVSLLALGGSVYFYISDASDCQKTLQQPLLIVGCALFVISLLGLVGSCCRVTSLLYVYLFFMFLLILGLICSTVFTILITNRGVGKVVSGRGFKEYRLGDYSNWLQNYAVNEGNWPNIKSCLVDSKVCSSENLGATNGQEIAAADFNKMNLSPTQSGCCKPPTYCGFEYKNATFWTIPKTGPAAPDTDCTTWNNNQQALCYDCRSCKAGILANIKKEWRLLAVINSCILVFVIIVYSIGCCALRNNRSSKYSRYNKGGFA